MMMKSLPWLAWLCVVLVSSVNAVAAPSQNRTPFRVGVLYWSMNIPGQVAMRAGLEAEARQINIDAQLLGQRPVELLPFVAGDGAAGIEQQIAQMSRLVHDRVDLIIVQPTDNAALAKPLMAANRAGIPVVAYDQYISGGKLVSYITSDNYQAGFLDGEYVAARFPDSTTLRVILVEYPHVSSTVERVNGFLDALKAAGQAYEISKTYIAVEPVSGRAAGKAILSDFPEAGSVDVVFTVNDGGGLAVVSELEQAGRNEIFVATIDGDPRSVQAVRHGGITRVDTAQFCGPMGAQAMRIAYRVLNDMAVPGQVLMPVFPVTAETMKYFTSWHGPVPAPFDKPWSSSKPIWNGELKLND